MRYLTCALSSSMLCGCIVVPESYYSPVSATGEVQRAACDTFGPRNSLVVEDEGVAVSITLGKRRYKESEEFSLDLDADYHPGNKYLVLYVGFEVGPNRFAVLPDQELTFSTNTSDSKKYKFNSLVRNNWHDSQPTYTDVAVGERLEHVPRKGNYSTRYWGTL